MPGDSSRREGTLTVALSFALSFAFAEVLVSAASPVAPSRPLFSEGANSRIAIQNGTLKYVWSPLDRKGQLFDLRDCVRSATCTEQDAEQAASRPVA